MWRGRDRACKPRQGRRQGQGRGGVLKGVWPELCRTKNEGVGARTRGLRDPSPDSLPRQQVSHPRLQNHQFHTHTPVTEDAT